MKPFTQKNLESLASQISVRSALNPVIWLCVVSLFLIIGATQVKDAVWLQIVLLIIGAIPWILTAVGFVFFMYSNPDYLRSEEYQIAARKIALGDKDHPNVQIIDASNLNDKPLVKQIKQKGAKHE